MYQLTRRTPGSRGPFEARTPFEATVALISIALLLFVFGVAAAAEPSGGPSTGATKAEGPKSSPTAKPDLAALKKVFEAKLGASVDDFTSVGYGGLYEVRMGTDIVYTDATADHLFVGNIIDLNSRTNLTRTRVDALVEASLPKYKFADFPLASAIKIVRGSGKRKLVIFEDPNCGYCKRLEKSLLDTSDVTLYVFLYPVLGPDSADKSKAIWCSADRARTWTDWMRSGVAIPPLTAAGTCVHPIDANLELGKKLRVDGTPTLFFTNGKRIPGAVEGDELVKLLAENG